MGLRGALAEFVTGKSFSQPLDTKPSAKAMCTGAPGQLTNPLAGSTWNGWGVSTSNARYQPSPGFAAADVPRLKLKWAFGFPGDLSANAQPVTTVIVAKAIISSIIEKPSWRLNFLLGRMCCLQFHG